MLHRSTEETIQRRLATEHGRIERHGRRRIGLVYPSPYKVGMSSLGFQTIYRALNGLDDTVAERAFLPDPSDADGPILAYESFRPVADSPVVAFSIAYELELFGLLTCLEGMGLAALAKERDSRAPLVIAGGPLTFVNPWPLVPFVDAIVMGEAEPVLAPLTAALFHGGDREAILDRLVLVPGVFVPGRSEGLPVIQRADGAALPARAAIWTPEASLANMFLIEVERGCSRGCTFCVMRRATDCGMRLVAKERVLAGIPEAAPRVGLVGAAVSDHPEITGIVRALVEAGKEVGLSSLRADRLTRELVELLVRGGNRTLTVAADGASERLRQSLDKKISAEHLCVAADLAAELAVPQLKLYVMVGLPDETDEDLEELATLTAELRRRVGPKVKLILGVSIFVPKPGTPLVNAPFIGAGEAERRMTKLRSLIAGAASLIPASGRWAWVENLIAHGTAATGLELLEAWRHGGSFAAIKRAAHAQRGD